MLCFCRPEGVCGEDGELNKLEGVERVRKEGEDEKEPNEIKLLRVFTKERTGVVPRAL